MSMIREELEAYLSLSYPDIELDTENTLAGPVTISFNTTEDESAEDEDRIRQAIARGALIFRTIFSGKESHLWVIAYEYEEDELNEQESAYLFGQLIPDSADDLITDEVWLNPRMFNPNDPGNELLDKVGGRITVGKIQGENIRIESLLEAIANRYNGLEPAIGQSIYFFDPRNNTGFHMYDDRGIFVWADEAYKLREIYHAHSDWIPDHVKADTAQFFQS